MNRWHIARACGVLLGIALVACIAGCASTAPEAEQKPPAESPAETTPAVEASVPIDFAVPTEDLYSTAASTANFKVYAPGYIPDGFGVLGDESEVEPGLVGISYGRGDDRLLVLQGGWDMGDPGGIVFAGATFGDMEASAIEGFWFAWGLSPAYGEDTLGVIAADPEAGATYAVFAVGADKSEVIAVAKGMAPVE